MPGVPLALCEREEIFCALVEDPTMGWAAIGRRVGRHRSTVAREVAAGGGRGRYRPAAAQRRADRQRHDPREALGGAGAAAGSDQPQLRLGRSPEAIRADLVAEGVAQAPCTETIYQAISPGGAPVVLRTRRRRRRCAQGRNPRSRSRGPNIAERPAASRSARWRATGRRSDHRRDNRSSMIEVDRAQSRYLIPITMPDGYDAEAVFAGLDEPRRARSSLTFDCGAEWANGAASPTTCRSCTRTRRGTRGQIENRTAKSAGGSPAAPNSARRPSRTPPQPPAPGRSLNHQSPATRMLTSPRTDH